MVEKMELPNIPPFDRDEAEEERQGYLLRRRYFGWAQNGTGSLGPSDISRCFLMAYNRMMDNKKALSGNVITRRNAAEFEKHLLEKYPEAQRQVLAMHPKLPREVFGGKMDFVLYGHNYPTDPCDVIPYEYKLTTRWFNRLDELPTSWIVQLAMYIALFGANFGKLVVFNTSSLKPLVLKVALNANERRDWRDYIFWGITLIMDAFRKKDPSILPIQPYKYCDYGESCPRKEECRIYFAEEFST